MFKFDILKTKYTNLAEQTLAQNKSILIESFIEYYGEEFRMLIENIFNEIFFILFLNPENLKLLLTNFPELITHEIESDLKSFLNGISLHNVLPLQNKDNMPSEYIGIINRSNISLSKFQNLIAKVIKQYINPVCISLNEIRLIFLPLFSLNERAIIHEVNHALVNDLIAILEDDNAVNGLHTLGLDINICGKVEYSNTKEHILEELLNDLSSFEIFEIFKRRGGDLSAICITNPVAYAYPYNFHLVSSFYNYFKELIKKARISLNKNILISRIDPSLYDQYLETINRYYSTDLDEISKNKSTAKKEVNDIVSKMIRKAEERHNLKRRELEAYYNELRNAGFNLKIINTYNPLDYEPNEPKR